MSRHFVAQARMFFPIVLTVGFLGLLFLALSPAAARPVALNASYPEQVAAAQASRASLALTAIPQTNATAGNTAFPLAWSSYETERTFSVALGDYDGDGDLDLAVGNRGYGTIEPIRLYRNEGGTLTTDGVWASTDGGADSLAWGDVDGDGDLDLVAASWNEPVRLYRNNNGLLTTSAAWSSVDGGGYSIALGDYDGDGDLDLAVGYWESNRLYRNDGGMLTTTAVWSSVNGGGYSVAWGDVDGDGDLDLTDGMRLYRNDNGTLTTSSIWSPVDGGSDTAAWGDMDGDGDLDLAVGNLNEARLYRNDGGTLTPSAVWSAASEGWSSFTTVAWGDYDGDGDLDLAVGHGSDEAGPPNQIYRNDGVASNGTPNFVLSWSSAELDDTQSVAWGDIDNDGDLDLVVGNDNQPNRLYRNDWGTLAANGEPSSDNCAATSVAWGDVDKDGDLDLAVGGWNQNLLYRNDAGILITNAVWSSMDGGSSSVAWGDVDSDGDLDLAAAREDRTGLYRNDNGILTTSAVWSSVDGGGSSVAWGDVDGDGDLDLAAGIRLYRNDNSALTSSAVWSAADGNDGRSVAWGDYDGDGDLDLAMGHRVYRNDNGTLTGNAVWSAAEDDQIWSVAWGDADGDGDLDLAVGNWNQPNRLYHNDNGKLTINAVWSSVEAEQTASIAWGDVDGDGDLDLAVANGENSDTPQLNRIYRNDNGVLTASAAWSSSETEGTSEAAWGDFDGDGDLDLAAGNRSDGPCYRVYRNARDARLLPGNIPTVRVARPGPNADLFSSPKIWSGLIPITYTLADAQGDQVKLIRAWYSPDGGGRWLPAVAATGTMTTNLGTSRFLTRTYTNNTTAPIPDLGKITSTLTLTPTDMIADIDVRLNVAHTWDQDLVIKLIAPFGRSVVLVNRRGGGANFIGTVFDDEAAIPIRLGVAPFTGRYRPEEPLSRFDGYSPYGVWQLTIADVAGGDYGTLLSWGMTITLNTGRAYTYVWDVGRSGVFGQLDDAVVRIQAVPATATTARNSIPGPYLYGANASQTFPFRVRGTQARVVSDTTPISNALVYRLPVTQTVGALPFTDLAGVPYHTDGQGYLQGRGQLYPGDRLVALSPLSATESYTLYASSATPTTGGLSMFTVPSGGGVFTLTVSAARPLVLFNLDVSLEWDARNDGPYLDQLEYDLKRASEILFDVTNGQAALGPVRVFQAKEHWGDAHIRIYATNALRPYAAQGGVVFTPTVEITNGHTITYTPGQVVMGATWNRYGDPGVRLGEDWPRAFAHELAHYVFFQDDDYLGLSSGRLSYVTTCTGSFMADAYRDDYSEFKPRSTWLPGCQNTLANQITGRADWETVQRFYPALRVTTNSGPGSLPLAVTQVQFVKPVTPTTTLIDPRFYLKDQNGASWQTGRGARAVLYHGDTLIDVGQPVVDQVLARGAQANDRLCVYDLGNQRLGCKVITLTGNQELSLTQVSNWTPNLSVTLPNTRTVYVQVRNVPTTGTSLTAQLFFDTGALTKSLSLNNDVYSTTFTIPGTLGGSVRVWRSNPPGEVVSDFSLGGNVKNPNMYGRNPNMYGRNPNMYGRNAPVVSGDGQVVVYADNLNFALDEFYVMQAAATLPALPPWLTPVSKGYWLSTSMGAPPLTQASLNLGYAQRAVPPGSQLRMYTYNVPQGWQALTTTLEPDGNSALAAIAGPGLYALLASYQVPLYGPGWNLVAYPVPGSARAITEALVSITGHYTTVYGYVMTDTAQPWRIYDVTLPDVLNTLRTLEYGKGYWINARDSVVWSVGGDAAHRPETLSNFGNPPATFYGIVQTGAGFTPLAGMTVTAYVNGQSCGQGETLAYAGTIWYSVHVFADGPQPTGCGATGRSVTFAVGNRPMRPVGVWSTSQVWRLDLRPAQRVYLPLIRK